MVAGKAASPLTVCILRCRGSMASNVLRAAIEYTTRNPSQLHTEVSSSSSTSNMLSRHSTPSKVHRLIFSPSNRVQWLPGQHYVGLHTFVRRWSFFEYPVDERGAES
jgi:hypothetical protein